jgi:hypothetical protein
MSVIGHGYDAWAAVGGDGGSYVVLCRAAEDADLGVIKLGEGRTFIDAQRRADEINATGVVQLATDERQIPPTEVRALLAAIKR